MQKVLFFTAFCALVVQSKAQNAVLFKIKYLPSHTYSATTKMVMNMDMDYDADSATLKQIKASGAKLPVMMNVETSLLSDIKTRTYNLNHEIPFTANIKQTPPKLTVNGTASPVPDAGSDQVVYGRCAANGKIIIEGIQGRVMTDSAKNAVMKMIETIEANVAFPKAPIKPGDSFAQDIDTDVPVPGFDAKMLMKVTYRLLSVSNGKATFSMDFLASIDKKAGNGLDISGTGTGQFVYDLGTHYTESMNETVNMTYMRPMPQQNVVMKGKVQMIMEQQVVIK
ncbi:hypothetical protein BEL04_22495 [Mucilaginibacter sp. PPCGB 2223]|uniref:hypothetical protein n=1 Tax=Mucilaginibacter sp. PPCGB 2223 TaxID=1886027 RepID=UPI0008252790|nr:hypothetical protein [Mucilaginibacter sp. PPCGB 2223]OCX50549.1 hypothetical protein BEL04_22495 [Mucilaginibacter sp. PPCGB 2223]